MGAEGHSQRNGDFFEYIEALCGACGKRKCISHLPALFPLSFFLRKKDAGSCKRLTLEEA